jgi:hypothetical protein
MSRTYYAGKAHVQSLYRPILHTLSLLSFVLHSMIHNNQNMHRLNRLADR